MGKNKGINRYWQTYVIPNFRFHCNLTLKDIKSKQLLYVNMLICVMNLNLNYLASIQYILFAARSRVRPLGQAPFL